MSFTRFPPVENADKDGLLAIGGNLDPDILLEAYSSGIFPWPFQEKLLAWFAPPKRAILMFRDFHVSKSLARQIQRSSDVFKVNTAFRQVIEACATSPNRKGQQGTWITRGVIEAYCDLHRRGFAHCVECWRGGNLIGGIYGVAIGGMFAGESMFYTEPNASKMCLYHLIQLLSAQGITWIDCQVMTSNLRRYGAIEVSRDKFMRLLMKSLRRKQLQFNAGRLFSEH